MRGCLTNRDFWHMSMSRAAQVKRDALHYMMQTAFVEIRASGSLNSARKFADVFHNLPMRLLECTASEDYDAEFADMLERAKRWGLDQYLQRLLAMATEAVAAKP